MLTLLDVSGVDEPEWRSGTYYFPRALRGSSKFTLYVSSTAGLDAIMCTRIMLLFLYLQIRVCFESDSEACVPDVIILSLVNCNVPRDSSSVL